MPRGTMRDQSTRLKTVLVFVAAAFFAACEGDNAGPVAAAQPATSMGASPAAQGPAWAPMTGKQAPSANVSKLQAWKDAEMIASLGEGRLEVIGTGDSMAPVYGDNTILVISRIPFEQLQSGMTIAYVNLKGHRVVHQLVSQDRLGWRVQGFNNEVEDRERVTRDNLIGVVYASLAYDPTLK